MSGNTQCNHCHRSMKKDLLQNHLNICDCAQKCSGCKKFYSLQDIQRHQDMCPMYKSGMGQAQNPYLKPGAPGMENSYANGGQQGGYAGQAMGGGQWGGGIGGGQGGGQGVPMGGGQWGGQGGAMRGGQGGGQGGAMGGQGGEMDMYGAPQGMAGGQGDFMYTGQGAPGAPGGGMYPGQQGFSGGQMGPQSFGAPPGNMDESDQYSGQTGYAGNLQPAQVRSSISSVQRAPYPGNFPAQQVNPVPPPPGMMLNPNFPADVTAPRSLRSTPLPQGGMQGGMYPSNPGMQGEEPYPPPNQPAGGYNSQFGNPQYSGTQGNQYQPALSHSGCNGLVQPTGMNVRNMQQFTGGLPPPPQGSYTQPQYSAQGAQYPPQQGPQHQPPAFQGQHMPGQQLCNYCRFPFAGRPTIHLQSCIMAEKCPNCPNFYRKGHQADHQMKCNGQAAGHGSSQSHAYRGAPANGLGANAARQHPHSGLNSNQLLKISTFPYNGPFISCFICRLPLNRNQPVKMLPCAHLFHDQCIDNHLRSIGDCPSCHLPITAAGSRS